MTEVEIDALMGGQEDENGCVNYEGQFSMPLYQSIAHFSHQTI